MALVRTSRARGLALATLTSVMWGCVPVAGKIALSGMSAPLLSTLRLAVAALVVWILVRRRGARVPARPSRLLLVGGLGLGVNYVAYMAGLEWAGAGTSQVLIQTAIVFLILLGVVFLGERLTREQVLGTLLALAGVVLVSWQDLETTGGPIGIGLILLAALSWAFYAVAQKVVGRTEGSGGTTFWVFLVAAVLTVPMAALAPMRHPDGIELIAIAFLCVNTVVAYWAFAESLRHIPASTAAVIATLGPAITFAILAVTNAMDQERIPYEPITPVKIIGALLTMGGVVLAILSAREPAAGPPPAAGPE